MLNTLYGYLDGLIFVSGFKQNRYGDEDKSANTFVAADDSNVCREKMVIIMIIMSTMMMKIMMKNMMMMMMMMMMMKMMRMMIIVSILRVMRGWTPS